MQNSLPIKSFLQLTQSLGLDGSIVPAPDIMIMGRMGLTRSIRFMEDNAVRVVFSWVSIVSVSFTGCSKQDCPVLVFRILDDDEAVCQCFYTELARCKV